MLKILHWSEFFFTSSSLPQNVSEAVCRADTNLENPDQGGQPSATTRIILKSYEESVHFSLAYKQKIKIKTAEKNYYWTCGIRNM